MYSYLFGLLGFVIKRSLYVESICLVLQYFGLRCLDSSLRFKLDPRAFRDVPSVSGLRVHVTKSPKL